MKEISDNSSAPALLPNEAMEEHPAESRVTISDDSIPDALARVLSSRTFQGAKAHKRFLQYVVEHVIGGNSHEVKEYTLGVHVFNRGATFDPRLDPIVRVEARKLRSRLTKYYETEGGRDRIRIELPAGGYVPAFRGGYSATFSSRREEQADRHDISDAAEAGESTAPVKTEMLSPPGPSLQLKRPAKRVTSWAFMNDHWGRARLLIGLLLLASATIYAGRVVLRTRGASALSPSIAVLPFQNLGDLKDESFSDGLTDELIDSLGRVRGLQVVARTSAFQFRTRTLDIRDIGKKLNVRTVLEGSVRIYGKRLRITAELDDTTNGYSVWSNSYERDFEDALFIQRDISQAIVATLEEKLGKVGPPKKLSFSPAKATPVNVQAYQDYLRGVYFWNKQTTDSIETAKNYFEHAIALDPGRAPNYTGLVRCYINLPSFTQMRARDVVPKIRELALKALDLDNSLPEAHTDLAYAYFLEYDWAGAEQEFKKGLELGPGDAIAHRSYSLYLINAGRLEQGLSESRVAQQLDPVSPSMPVGTARALYLMRRYDKAIEEYKKALALDPQFSYAHLGLGTIYIQQRKYPEAVAELQLAQERVGHNPFPLSELARMYPMIGRATEARAILRGFLEQSAAGSFSAKPIAKIYLALGDTDQAFAWLDQAVGARDVYLYLKSDPIWDPLRSDPRFYRVLQAARLTTFP
jgi:TolB-like protein/Tfp pilus assembly protein PilF